jgi:NADP-dependent 3-hydroxy acid dehydrogenase YdfG
MNKVIVVTGASSGFGALASRAGALFRGQGSNGLAGCFLRW